MGTPAFAVPSLEALIEAGHEVTRVFCQPDRPAGRGRALQVPPIKQLALERGIPIELPTRLRDPDLHRRLESLGLDAIVVAAYGRILPKAMIDLPRLGAINVHGSILPRWRGAAPIQRAILAGDPVTGVTIMQMSEGMDEGDVLFRSEMEIAPNDTGATLAARMAKEGARILIDTLGRLARGEIVPEAQDDDLATLAPMIRKEEGEVDWTISAVAIERAVRAFTPWPSAFTHLGGRRWKLLEADVEGSASGADPGTVTEVTAEGARVATGDGILRVLRLQPEGKKPLRAREALSGRLLEAGQRFERLASARQHDR